MNYIMRLLILFRPYWGWMILGIVISFLSVMANIILLSLSGWFITAMGIAGIAGLSINYFTPSAIIRACAIMRTGGRYAERLVTHEATFRFMAEMRVHIYNRIESMSLTQSSHYRTGDLLSRLRGDIDVLEGFYINLIVPSIVAILGMSIICSTFAWYDIRLAIIELALLLLVGFVMPFFLYHFGKKEAEDCVNLKALLKEKMVGNFQAMNEMIVYGQDTSIKNDLLFYSDKLNTTQKKLALRDGFSQSINSFIANIGLLCAFILAYDLYNQHILNAAYIAMLPLMALASFDMVMPLSAAFQTLGAVKQAAKRIFDLDQYTITAEYNRSFPFTSLIDLKMENVFFSYNESTDVLKNTSLHFASGDTVLIRGHSGIGKSSIINLLTRLYQPDKGNIFLNGRNYLDIDVESVQRNFAVADQNPHIFIGTLRGNLLIANATATSADLDRVCKEACLYDMIKQLPNGYDTYIGEGGSTLSGGEIRRLSVARALLKDAPCLLLDEPTESLDHKTGEMLIKNILNAYKEKAILIISHEQSISKNDFDQIIDL